MTRPQLLTFHFAGGNCNSFKFMDRYLIDFDILNFELPGRGMRSEEKLITDFTTAKNDLFKLVKAQLKSEDLVIYGHSMGALFAFEIARMLELEKIQPKQLIVTGHPGPGIITNKGIYQLNDIEFISEVNKLGGLPKEFLESAELQEYFLPILRADFELCEKNGISDKVKINTPIFCTMGDLEKFSSQIKNWEAYTSSEFTSEILPGKHFFIYDWVQTICEKIKVKVFSDQ